MTSSTLPDILKLRLLVGYLGEGARYAWWMTSFFDASSRHFLDPVFPNTVRLAQYHGVLEAARRVHDEHLSMGCYHLFRLPEEVEQDLHHLVQSPQTEAFTSSSLRDKDQALRYLEGLAGMMTVQGVGPVAIGNVGDLGAPRSIETVAAAYLSAFQQGLRLYPYLVRQA